MECTWVRIVFWSWTDNARNLPSCHYLAWENKIWNESESRIASMITSSCSPSLSYSKDNRPTYSLEPSGYCRPCWCSLPSKPMPGFLHLTGKEHQGISSMPALACSVRATREQGYGRHPACPLGSECVSFCCCKEKLAKIPDQLQSSLPRQRPLHINTFTASDASVMCPAARAAFPMRKNRFLLRS